MKARARVKSVNLKALKHRQAPMKISSTQQRRHLRPMMARRRSKVLNATQTSLVCQRRKHRSSRNNASRSSNKLSRWSASKFSARARTKTSSWRMMPSHPARSYHRSSPRGSKIAASQSAWAPRVTDPSSWVAKRRSSWWISTTSSSGIGSTCALGLKKRKSLTQWRCTR